MENRTECRVVERKETLTHAIITAVADEKDIAPEAVADRVYDVVDPDGLNRLFSPGGPDTPRQNARLTFTIDGCEVIIEGGELIMVTPKQAPAERFESRHGTDA